MIWRAILFCLLCFLCWFARAEPGQSAPSSACRECHAVEFNLWASSHHALAERPVQNEIDLTAFGSSHPFKTGSITNQTRIQNGQYQIITLGFKTNIEAYPVDRVIGTDPVRQFLTATTGGRWQTHEASYDTRKDQWFDVYGDEDRQPGEWGHWTGRGMNWNSMCASCHNTFLQKNYDPATDTYHTTMTEMGVGCEACHGPLQTHVAWQKAHPGSKTKDPTVPSQTPAQTFATCGSCHSRRDDLTGQFIPGDAFSDHFSLQTLDEGSQWYADGQVHGEDYEFDSFISSKMSQNGVTCQDCHDAHSGRTRLPGNDLCMRCHIGAFPKAPIINPIEHGHHKPDGAGDTCVGCHMPVTVYMQRHPRHDHGLTIPDPLLTRELDIPNACNRCHTDQSPAWAIEYAKKWYGAKMERRTRKRARWIAAAQRGDEKALPPILALMADRQENPYWRAVAAGLLWQWAARPEVRSNLLAQLNTPHPLLREKAVNSLEPVLDSTDVLQALRTSLNDPFRNVRVAAAWLLKTNLDTNSLAARDLQTKLAINADQPAGLYRVAMYDLARGQPQTALAQLQKALLWDPYSPPLHYEAAQILTQLGRPEEAAKIHTPTPLRNSPPSSLSH